MKSADHIQEPILNQRLFELIVHHAPACIALLRGPDFVFELVNPGYAAIAPTIAMPGKRVVDVFPDAAGFITERLQHVLDSGQTFSAEDVPITIDPYDGSPAELRYFTVSYTRIKDGSDHYTHSILVLALETTARKNAEAATDLAIDDLKKQWRTFDIALSNSPDFIYTFDLEGRFTYVNNALLALLQLPLEAALGKNFFDLNYPPDLATTLQRQIARVAATKEIVRDQTPFTGPAGPTRFYEYIFVPVLSASGEVEAIAGSTRDITDRKQAEEEAREHQAHLLNQGRLESLGVLAGGVAHDFNNLLVGVLGNASLLSERFQGEEKRIADEIVLAGQRAAALTRQMLDYTGKGHYVVEMLDLNKLVQEYLGLVRASLASNVAIELELTPEACYTQGDRTQLHQVIVNLLINAAEAVSGNSATVSLRTVIVRRTEARFNRFLHATVAPGSYAVLEVRDTGTGIAPNEIARIFEPFYTTKFTGRGLGLAAVLGIVRGHKGDIEVESWPGIGTTFRVLLPLCEKTPFPLPAPGTAVAALGRTLLVVDDEATVRRMVKSGMERRGFQVLLAADGQEALSVLTKNPDVSLVILDLTMPVMTGEQTLPHILAAHPEMPVILSSGFSEEEIYRRFASHRIAGVLQKPYTVSTILAKVSQALAA